MPLRAGFRFNCQGSCTAIPQAFDASPAVLSQCKVAGVYATTVKANLIWVWPAGDTPSQPEPEVSEVLQVSLRAQLVLCAMTLSTSRYDKDSGLRH